MAKLILSMDGLVLKEIVLRKERTTIGRRAHNDIQIDNLSISGEHAAIVCILNDAFLEDMNSTNGTYVNGQPVKKQVLKDNDVVELGKYRLKFVKDIVDATVMMGFEKGVEVDARQVEDKTLTQTLVTLGEVGADDKIAATDPDTHLHSSSGWAAQRSGETPDGAVLGAVQMLNGKNVGREIVLSKSLTSLGKPGTQVAAITRRPNGYYITHVEGANFPLVNGQAIGAQIRPLADHDVIEIAGTKMEFYLKSHT